jgi:hypothetical protein
MTPEDRATRWIAQHLGGNEVEVFRSPLAEVIRAAEEDARRNALEEPSEVRARKSAAGVLLPGLASMLESHAAALRDWMPQPDCAVRAEAIEWAAHLIRSMTPRGSKP